jgi:hypothetical protein
MLMKSYEMVNVTSITVGNSVRCPSAHAIYILDAYFHATVKCEMSDYCRNFSVIHRHMQMRSPSNT